MPSIHPLPDPDHLAASAIRASGRVPSAGCAPRSGELFPDFTLPATASAPASLAGLRGRKSAVLVFAGLPPLPGPLTSLLAASHVFDDEDSVLIAVLAMPPGEARRIHSAGGWPFPVLADADAAVHARSGAGPADRAVYVTDRFGEVFGVWRTAAGASLPAVTEVVHTLRQISLQCPECGIPEWPEE